MTRTTAVLLLPVAVLLALPRSGATAQPLRILVLHFYPEGRIPALVTAQPLKPQPGDDELRKLLKERYNAALREVKAWYAEIFAGRKSGWPRDDMLDAALRALETRLELTDRPEDHVRIRQEQVEWAKEYEQVVGFKHQAGRVDLTQVGRAQYLRLDAEIKLLRAKRLTAAPPPPKPEPVDDQLRKLFEERSKATEVEMQAWASRFQVGDRRALGDEPRQAALRMFDAKADAASKPEDLVRVRQEQVEWAEEGESITKQHYAAGRFWVGAADLEKARYRRLDAEIKLLLAKRQAAAGKPR